MKIYSKMVKMNLSIEVEPVWNTDIKEELFGIKGGISIRKDEVDIIPLIVVIKEKVVFAIGFSVYDSAIELYLGPIAILLKMAKAILKEEND